MENLIFGIQRFITSNKYRKLAYPLNKSAPGYPGNNVANFKLLRVSVAFSMATTIFYLFGLVTTVITQIVSLFGDKKYMTLRDFVFCVICK